MQGNGIEHDALGEELGMDVLVAEVLSEIEFLLGVDGVLGRHAVDGHACRAVGGNVNQACIVLETEVDAMGRAAHVDILNLGALGEVLHHGGTVEDGVYLAVDLDVLGDVAVDNEEAGAE